METTQIASAKNFNTNNAWGFGGGYGVQYNFNSGSYLREGKACYRHSPPQKFKDYYNSLNERLIDDSLVYINGTSFKLKKDMLVKAIEYIIEANPTKEDFQNFVKQLNIK
mgnify:CR=1 FL=1